MLNLDLGINFLFLKVAFALYRNVSEALGSIMSQIVCDAIFYNIFNDLPKLHAIIVLERKIPKPGIAAKTTISTSKLVITLPLS